MRKNHAVLGVVSSLGLFFVSANAHAGEPGANWETQQLPQPPPPNNGWTQGPPVAAPAPALGPPAAKSSSVTLKVSTESRYDGATAAPPPPPQPPQPSPGPRLGPPVPADADHPNLGPAKAADPLADARLLHGFRLGYSYVANYDKPLEALDGASFKEKTGTKSPNNFLIGYEVVIRMAGHSWLNVILVGNGLLAGLEQSKVLPSGNALIGFEFNNSFQVGVGAHLTPLKGQEAHTAFAAGWTPRVGTFYVPVHAFFVPDVDGNHRMGMLTGVTF